MTVTVVTAEIEQVEEVADGRRVERHIRIVFANDRVGKVVAAAVRDRAQLPVAFDELEDGDVVGVVVRNVSRLGVRRDDDQRDARAVAEEVERLHVAGVIVTAAFIEGDQDGGVFPEIRIGLNGVDDFLCEAFEEVELRRSGMAVNIAAGLDE